MCGRYVHTSNVEAIARLFGITGPLPNTAAHYNAAPGQDLPVVRRHPDTGERRLDALHWGLVPSWAKDRKIAWKLINARAETIDTTGAFRSAFRLRRCLVPADGFYEWEKRGTKRQPWVFTMADRTPFALAGLWEGWRPEGSEEWLRSFTVVTTAANPLVAPIHDRMPAILPPAAWASWLGEEPCAPAALKALLQPFPAAAMTTWPVSPRMNSGKVDEPSVLDPVTPDDVVA
ncbi:MAG: SOS response-associated peptidase [Alphaproteobacteria bacterium]|nr:SOS response-associated peptidase [Alphaproteobacteria bacterium]